MNHIVSRGHTRPVTEIQFVEDGANRTLLASSAHDKTPQLRNGETGDWIGTFHGHKGAVWSIKIDQYSRTLAATASGDFTAKLWNLSNGQELYEFKHKHVVKSIDFTDDSLKVATGAQDGFVKIFDTCQPSSLPFNIKASSSITDGIMKITWIDDKTILVGKRNGSIEIWDSREDSSNNNPALRCDLIGGCVVIDMEVTKSKDVVLAASGKHVNMLKLSDLSLIRSYEMPDSMRFNEEGGASLSPDGKSFLAGASDLWLREFSVETGDLLQTYKGHHGPIRCVRYHPSGTVGASGSEDGTIRLWELCGVNAQF